MKMVTLTFFEDLNGLNLTEKFFLAQDTISPNVV